MLIRDLHTKVLQSFYNFSIDLEQAIAFATIPNPDAQWTLLQQLGPFVSDKGVIDAIKNGDTVIETPDNQTIILPSREKVNLQKVYQRSLSAQNEAEKTEFKVAA